MNLEEKVKELLLKRGFSEKLLLNNRGLIGATIDETMSALMKNEQRSCSPKEQVKPDKYEVIMAGNIMVAQGYKCGKCGLIRAYDRPSCNCH